MLDSFVNQYRVKYKLLTQTWKQIKTTEDEIVLLPYDAEHKIIGTVIAIFSKHSCCV